MAIGPVQLLVLGFSQPNFDGAIRGELTRLHDNNVVRVIDALAVYRKAGGEVEVLKESQLSADEQIKFGAVVGALIGLGTGEEEGIEEGAKLGAELVQEHGGLFTDDEASDIAAEIPEGTAAALVLLEHRWASPLRDAIAGAGGFRLSSEFISPLDLLRVGIISSQEAEALLATGGASM